MIQYKIAAGLLGVGVVLWGLTRLFYKPGAVASPTSTAWTPGRPTA